MSESARRRDALVVAVTVLVAVCLILAAALFYQVRRADRVQAQMATTTTSAARISSYTGGFATNYGTVVEFGQATVQVWVKNTGNVAGAPSCQVVLTFVQGQDTVQYTNFVASATFTLPPIEPGHTVDYKGLVQGSDSNLLLQPLCLNGTCQDQNLTLPGESFVKCET